MKEIGIAIVIDEKLESTVKWAVESGFRNCQLQIWKMELLTDTYAYEVRRILESYNMEITGLWCGWHGPIRWDFKEGPSILGLVPAEYRATRMKNLFDGAAFARILGVKDVITHVGFVPLNCRDPLYTGVVSALRYLTEKLQACGQNFLMETGQEPPIVLKRLIEDVGADNLYINYDPANLMMYGNGNPVDGIDVLGTRIRSVHAKDGSYPISGSELGAEYPIGKGDVDFPQLLDKLQRIGYEGPVSIEYEIEAGNETQRREMLEGKAYLERLLQEN